ncbi:flagellar assembly protein FliW [Anaeromicropila populeti]|uniref:Flagellar assembly factor FliW n=1 Tax=Anaeromicropila populeti TaxID=37658 RepID=A0A1I6HX23_9FIRM|nr:flagellar assembly protein FliW [Anaeromicropila populeti]SFR58967.1 flagellar assembly factor FliW [Anaeromicropila populeti]
MLINTKCFGEIDLEENKIIHFADGLMGFEDYKKFTILYDIEDEKKSAISWLQCIEEPGLALPVINPLHVREDYNPTIEDELLKPLGDVTSENIVVLLVVTVPNDVKKTTANLKAPIIINSDTRQGCQIIVENQDYSVRYCIFEENREKKGERTC